MPKTVHHHHVASAQGKGKKSAKKGGEVLSSKDKSLRHLKQAQGTLAKIIQMSTDDRYCPEIIQQVDSVIGLLKTAKYRLLAGHLDSCMIDQLSTNKQKAIEELLKIYNLSN